MKRKEDSFWLWLRNEIIEAAKEFQHDILGEIFPPSLERELGLLVGAGCLIASIVTKIPIWLRFLILLGLIPSFLITMHGTWREEKRREQMSTR